MQQEMSNRKISLPLVAAILLFAAVSAIAVGCNKKQAESLPEATPLSVSVKSAEDLASMAYSLDYPAMVVSEQEAKIIAKTNGTVDGFALKVGDKVEIGDMLLYIDDITGSMGRSFSNYQVRQAELAAQQAYASYQMAQTSYDNLVISAAKDLRQAEIARDQAKTGESNVGSTLTEQLKAAQLAYDTAKISTEQARLSLVNRQTISNQSASDTETNALLAAQTAVDTSNAIASSLVNTLDINQDVGGIQPYNSVLGNMDPVVRSTGRASYESLKTAIEDFKKTDESDPVKRVDAAVKVVQRLKNLTDAAKKILDNTQQSYLLPLTSLAGVSISSLQQTITGYQTQANASLSQLTAMRQALTNVDLNNDATLDSLEKAYELSKQQEQMALQSLQTLKATGQSQTDQAGYGAQAAENQFQAAKTKLETQLAVGKSQAEMAYIQYQNALASLSNLTDMHEIIAPISGTITKKSVENGNTVSAGQVLASIGTPDKVKVQFFIDESRLEAIVPGLTIEIKDSEGRSTTGTVLAVTPQADAVTKRFMVEAKPTDPDFKLTLGTIASVTIPLIKIAQPGSLLMPLSALNVSPSQTTIYLVEDGSIRTATATIGKIEGETAQITSNLPDKALVVIEGNKLVQEGDKVNIKE